MKAFNPIFIKISFILILLSSCSPDLNLDTKETEIVAINESGIQELNIPDGFDFSTSQEVEVTINDYSKNVKYEIFAYTDDLEYQGTETYENQEGEIVTEAVYKNDVLENLVFTGVPQNGKLSQKITIPSYYDKLYIRRNVNLKYNASIETISNKQVNYTHPLDLLKAADTKVDDFLYCVNGSAELFQVDPLNGDLTYLSDMPMGSFTAAIDQENKALYSIGRSSPYPLMKYSIADNSWETVANTGRGGPRLDYNYRDGLLYFSTRDKLYTYDPSDGSTINSWTINGLHSTSGGDLLSQMMGRFSCVPFQGCID